MFNLLFHRLYWLNISGLVIPAFMLAWIDRRAGRRGEPQ